LDLLQGHRRPEITDYQNASIFVHDIIAWKKSADPGFSVRRAAELLQTCSPTLVSLIARGQRKLSPERVADFAQLLGLSSAEKNALFVLSGGKSTKREDPLASSSGMKERAPRRIVRSGLFKPWFHLHLWEAARLPNFRMDAFFLFELLRGIASPVALGKSVRYLLTEGYLRRILDGRIVPDHPTLETADESANEQIQQLHVRSLQLAARLVEEIPVPEREAGLVLMSLSPDGFQKLKAILKEFNETLAQFSEDNAGGDCLYQVLVNAVPVSVRPPPEGRS
jgi:uncharacterized protein (TIGR02147 family)